LENQIGLPKSSYKFLIQEKKKG